VPRNAPIPAGGLVPHRQRWSNSYDLSFEIGIAEEQAASLIFRAKKIETASLLRVALEKDVKKGHSLQ
jgi:hypothetical protein